MDKKQKEKILILDFGGQYSQLIARRVRECNVYSVVKPYDYSLDKIKKMNPEGIILSGGPESVEGNNVPVVDKQIFYLGIPILGICYGMQLMADLMPGGKVRKAHQGEYGKARLTIQSEDIPLFSGIEKEIQVWMSHGDHIKEVPADFAVAGRTDITEAAVIYNREQKLYGVQFHPEVKHTQQGQKILSNFLFEVCKIKPEWTMEDFVEQQLSEIRAQVGNEKIICGLSGGVDSSVASALVHKAVGDQLTCIFVDHGLLRKGEASQVRKAFGQQFNIPLVYVDARDRFLDKLQGITAPEKKRKIIGNEFIRVFEEEAGKLEKTKFLVQGTIYSDVIESGENDADTIKSHHNVGGLPDDMQFELVEPLRMLFKDEVRQIGEVLGLPEDIVWRQPFPGPGLAIRIIGEVTPKKLALLREADAVVQEEIKKADLYRDIWQSFAVLPDLRSVGVMGDERTYGYPVILRVVTSDDAMTADWARLPYEVLESISCRVVNEVSQVNRVVYDITSKPPATIEWE